MSYTSDFLKELEKLSKKTTSTAQKAKRRADITVGKQSEDKFTRDFFTELYKLEEEEALKKNQEKEKTRFDDSNKARSTKSERKRLREEQEAKEEEDKWKNRKAFVLDSLGELGAPTAHGTLGKDKMKDKASGAMKGVGGGGRSFADVVKDNKKRVDRYVDIGGGYKINNKTLTLVDENHRQIGKYDEKTGIIKSEDGTRYFRIKEDGSLRWYDEGMKALGFSDNNSWFQAGAFEDGYDFGDVSKSILSTGRQLGRGVVRGVVNIGETTIDTAAYLGGLAGKGIGYLAGADDSEIAGWDNMVSEFIAKDIIDEDAIAKVVVPDIVSTLTNGQQTEEENALVGGKMTGLAESAGQLALQAGLQYIGVPWFVTSGVSSFGSETENALKQDATLGEAGFSASVSALGEIATEKVFGAFKFQGKGLGDGLKTVISRNIKNKTARTLANLGLDFGGEGVEELLSGHLSAAGQKLSYATDKEIRELFSSEDKWDAFIGGAILGGGNNVANIVKSAVNKVDPVTHLTENEQKVVDRVYKDAVEEAEKDGKKLDGTEKNKLYDGILKNLEKGYISTDIIEEVLGGDTYKQYKDTIDSEDAAMKEFEDLYEGEELEQQKNSFKEHSKLDSIREQLGIEVSDKVKGDRLIESYNEKIRRGQQFTADLTKYSEKAQAVVQKAINSGVLNNTNRSHELVDLVAKIAGDKGIDFDFTNNEKLKESGFAIEGSTINGFVTKDGVTLNVQSQKALNSVVGHEIAHVLEGTELYNELQKIAFEYAETKGEYKDRLRRANDIYRNVEGYQGVDGFNKIKSEVLADIVGDYLFTDPDFINTLSTNHRNVFQKMYDEVKYLYKIATAGSKEAKELEKLKKVFEDNYRNTNVSNDASAKTQYSISETTDGRKVAVVDNDILSNINTENWDKATKKIVQTATAEELKKFTGGFTINGIEYIDSQKSRREYTRSNYSETLARKNTDAYLDKMRAATVLDDVIQVATDWKNDGSLTHSRNDFVDFIRGKTLIKSGERTYRAIVLAGITKDGKAIFHDVEDVYPEHFEIKKMESSTAVSANEMPNNILEDSIADTVAQEKDSVKPQYSLSTDSDGKKLSKEQQEFFKDSKMRDDNGHLIPMYHGTTRGGFHTFDTMFSDDDTSFFFVDDNAVASTYSGTSETYAAKTFKTAEDFNNFFAEIGAMEYSVTEEMHDGYKWFMLYEDGTKIASSETPKMLYEEFRDWTGLGEGSVNYKTYLNLTNPLIVDADGRDWNALPSVNGDTAQYDYIKVVKVGDKNGEVTIEYAMNGDPAPVTETVDLYKKFDDGLADALSNLAPGESLEGIYANPSTTREYAKYAKENGYDGVIFKNIYDIGGYGNNGASEATVAIAFESNQIKSVDNAEPTEKEDIRYSLSSIANTFFGDENMSAYEFKNANYTETQGYKDYVEQCLNNYRQSRTDFDEGKARKAIEDSIHGIVRVAIASKEAGYDIYDDATKRSKKDSKKRLLFSSLEPNSDYFTSNDISTICDKRKNFAEIYDDIVKAEEKKGVPPGKRFFDNVDNYFYLHKLMADKGLTQPCRQCYVESMRKNLAPMANAFLRLVKETNPNNMANDQLYHQKGKNKGGIKTNNAATRMWVIEKLAEYGMTVNDLSVQTLTTEDGLAQLKIQAPMIYEAFNSFYGQSKPKMPKAATPFRFGELTALLTDEHGKIKKSLVDKINATGGFRLQSYSDFQIQNYTDVLQAIFEAGTLGLKGHAYTKVPAFLDATEGTNLKRNISIFMYKDGDEWKLDKNDSFPYELEEIYDIVNADKTGNTGIIAVSQNTDMSAWIMANDYVGYGIPFHKSGLKMGTVRDTVVKTEDGREVKGYTGTKDHTKQQTEVWAKSSADHKALTKVKKGINIYEFWDFDNNANLSKNELIEKNVKAYIDACESAGYLPKFREYVMNNSAVLNGVLKYAKQLGFASPDATIDDISFKHKGYTIPYGYYKFLGDFGMFTPDGKASAQDTLSLENYDFDKAVDFFANSEELRRNEILQQFSNGKERTKYRESNLSAGELADIVKQKRREIAEGVASGELAPSKKSLSNNGEAQKTYGRYNIMGKDVALDIAPVQETANDIAPTSQPVEQPTQPVQTTQPAQPMAKDIAPTREYEAIRPQKEKQPKMVRVDATVAEQQTAQILTEEPQVKKGKMNILHKAAELFVDKGAVFERLAKKTKNRELEGKYNFMHYSNGNAQNFIGNGAEGVKSLKSIVDQVENSGKTHEFSEYMYHLHNSDRMTLAERGYGDNKAVFGDHVTAVQSLNFAQQIEAKNPEFRQLAVDIYNINRHLRQMMVDAGIISQETADLWQNMYPHYVPIRREGYDGVNINVPLDTNKTGVNAPVKKATGGNSNILPMFDTMAQRILQTYRAVDKNRFGVELKNTLGTTIAKNTESVDGILDNIDKHEELLQKGKNGNAPTFTVFENGEKVTFEITDEMYDAMKPTSDALAYTNKALNAVSNVRRGLITEYNPVFLATNAIKDAQDVLINSQHPVRTYANMPRAWIEMLTNGKMYQEYLNNGGDQNTYFEKDSNTFTKEKSKLRKVVGFPLDAIAYANNFIERVPRLAEYMASRKQGRSIQVSMLDAARVTTNFAAGGDVTKLFNRNGATFLNASVQGASQQWRNIQEARMEGFKGWAKLAGKTILAGLPALLLNGLLWDDDEEYEELSDYVKENYYIVGKFGDGQFVRIPKGRTVAVIQEALQQVWNASTGDDKIDGEKFLQLALNNLAPNSPLDNNVISPFIQAATNKAWHGGDIVPQSMQDVPAAEQYDESTDSLSRWLGEKFDVSPMKINYLLDQYSGGIGDTLLPMMTPEAERGTDTFAGKMVSPWVDKFTTDSVLNNQNVTDFYDLKDSLTINANSSKATDDDILKSKYMSSVNAELSDLYKLKRDIQNSNKYSDSKKFAESRKVQEQINETMRNAMATYENISYEEDVKTGDRYAVIGDKYFKLTEDELNYTWETLNKDAVAKYKITSAAGDSNYATDGTTHYAWIEPDDDSDDKPTWKKLTDSQVKKQKDVTKKLGITPDEYWSNRDEDTVAMYDWVYDNPEKFTVAEAVTDDFTDYWKHKSIMDEFDATDDYGKTVSGLKKKRVREYIYSLDIDEAQKHILYKSMYNTVDDHNYEIIEYLNGRDDISYKEMKTILTELGFKVSKDGVITWD